MDCSHARPVVVVAPAINDSQLLVFALDRPWTDIMLRRAYLPDSSPPAGPVAHGCVAKRQAGIDGGG